MYFLPEVLFKKIKTALRIAFSWIVKKKKNAFRIAIFRPATGNILVFFLALISIFLPNGQCYLVTLHSLGLCFVWKINTSFTNALDVGISLLISKHYSACIKKVYFMWTNSHQILYRHTEDILFWKSTQTVKLLNLYYRPKKNVVISQSHINAKTPVSGLTFAAVSPYRRARLSFFPFACFLSLVVVGEKNYKRKWSNMHTPTCKYLRMRPLTFYLAPIA